MLILGWDSNWWLFRKERRGGDWVKYEHFFCRTTTFQPIIANNCQAPITPIISHGSCLQRTKLDLLQFFSCKVRIKQNRFWWILHSLKGMGTNCVLFGAKSHVCRFTSSFVWVSWFSHNLKSQHGPITCHATHFAGPHITAPVKMGTANVIADQKPSYDT